MIKRLIKWFFVWVDNLYFQKPRLARLLFGVNPRAATIEELISMVWESRFYLFLWLVIALFVLFGVRGLEQNLSACVDGTLFQLSGVTGSLDYTFNFSGV